MNNVRALWCDVIENCPHVAIGRNEKTGKHACVWHADRDLRKKTDPVLTQTKIPPRAGKRRFPGTLKKKYGLVLEFESSHDLRSWIQRMKDQGEIVTTAHSVPYSGRIPMNRVMALRATEGNYRDWRTRAPISESEGQR